MARTVSYTHLDVYKRQLITAAYLGDRPQTDRVAVTNALHYAFLTLGGLTLLSSLSFWTLRSEDGESVSRGNLREVE